MVVTISHECLRKCKLLSDRNPDFLDQLLPQMQVKLFGKDDVIAKEGDDAEVVYFLYRGDVQVTIGKTEVAKLSGDGSIVGDLAVFGTPMKRTVTIRALSFCDCRVMDCSKFTKILKPFQQDLAFFRTLAEQHAKEIEGTRQQELERQKRESEERGEVGSVRRSRRWSLSLVAARRRSCDEIKENIQEQPQRRQSAPEQNFVSIVSAAAIAAMGAGSTTKPEPDESSKVVDADMFGHKVMDRCVESVGGGLEYAEREGHVDRQGDRNGEGKGGEEPIAEQGEDGGGLGRGAGGGVDVGAAEGQTPTCNDVQTGFVGMPGRTEAPTGLGRLRRGMPALECLTIGLGRERLQSLPPVVLSRSPLTSRHPSQGSASARHSQHGSHGSRSPVRDSSPCSGSPSPPDSAPPDRRRSPRISRVLTHPPPLPPPSEVFYHQRPSTLVYLSDLSGPAHSNTALADPLHSASP
mmetsp:Transcript_60812/g.130704  ORF Transcript_60812/g.130704 Transcript_60812/m.130704 type:complete len:464 (-) Transcript_60812:253-1644(-)